MTEEFELVVSPLSQEISSAGKTVKVDIYGDGADGWILEAVDEFNNSTVWDDPFPTDSAALAEAKSTILAEGIDSLIGPDSGTGNW
jgi:hypothetical protein